MVKTYYDVTKIVKINIDSEYKLVNQPYYDGNHYDYLYPVKLSFFNFISGFNRIKKQGLYRKPIMGDWGIIDISKLPNKYKLIDGKLYRRPFVELIYTNWSHNTISYYDNSVDATYVMNDIIRLTKNSSVFKLQLKNNI